MINIKRYSYILALTALVGFGSCSEWDDHYEGKNNADTSSLNLYEALSQNSETSTFAHILAKAGYDKILASSQTYTVFAPDNEALSGFDTNDEEAVKRLVSNHIARYTIPTSTDSQEGVRMLNGKIYYFDNAGSFEGCQLEGANERTANGIIHQLKAQIPYAQNLYEYIKDTPNTSKLYEFIHRFDETKFDEENSTEIDIDEQGRPIYDSIMVSYNNLLEHKIYGLGHIAKEDSAYTMLIPNNDAWNAAYQRIAPYYKVYDADAHIADSIQDVRTGLAIVSDLIYRGKMASPATKDSLISTSGSVIHHPANLFAGAESHKASNGYFFTVGNLAYDNTETYNKLISVEAEEQKGRTYNNGTTSLYTRNVKNESSVKQVSGDTYIEVEATSASSQAGVTFTIPNVLSGKYNIYAVFLPATMDGEEAELDSTKVQFSLSYKGANGKIGSKKSATLTTKGKEATKLLAFSNFEFPVSDYTDNLWRSDEENHEEDITPSTTLFIQTNVTKKDYTSKKFVRLFRLDRIILEPIKN